MFGRDPRLRARLKNNFGKNPIDGNIYYNAENRMNKVRKYHDEINQRIDEREIKGKIIDDITWDDLEMDKILFNSDVVKLMKKGANEFKSRLKITYNSQEINKDTYQYIKETLFNMKRFITYKEKVFKKLKFE